MAAMAAQESAASKITNPPGALHMPCHIAPWGMQSFDQSVYMHWRVDVVACARVHVRAGARAVR